MKTFENCTIRKKSIKSGIGDCGQDKSGVCRGYINGMDHGNPIPECQRCRCHSLQTTAPPATLPQPLIKGWEEMRRAAKMLQDRTGKIVSGPNGKYVQLKERQ